MEPVGDDTKVCMGLLLRRPQLSRESKIWLWKIRAVNLDYYIVAYAHTTVNPNGYKVLLFILLFKSWRLYNQTSTSTKIVFNFFFKYNV